LTPPGMRFFAASNNCRDVVMKIGFEGVDG
jgi:hypothetical protein